MFERHRFEAVIDPTEDRREKPRITEPFPARMWGVDVEGRKFETEVRLANLSTSGLCVTLPYRTTLGGELLAVIRFLADWREDSKEGSYARAAVWGRVVRSSGKRDGRFETAVKFHGHLLV